MNDHENDVLWADPTSVTFGRRTRALYPASPAEVSHDDARWEWASRILLPITGTSVLGLMFIAGTGGTASANALSVSMSRALTGSTCSISSVLARREPNGASHESLPELTEIPEQLAFIQYQFSMNVSELSDGLNVSRPTVYAWLRGESDPHGRNAKRIDSLYRLACEWRLMSAVPMGHLRRQQFPDSSPFVTLISADDIDTANLRAVLQKVSRLAAEVQRRSRSETEAAASKGSEESLEDDDSGSISEESGY